MAFAARLKPNVAGGLIGAAIVALAGFALLILMVSAFNAAALLSDAAYSRIPMNQIFKLIGLRDLITAEVLLPTALYMGVLTTLNQWHRDREAYALYGAGVLPAHNNSVGTLSR